VTPPGESVGTDGPWRWNEPAGPARRVAKTGQDWKGHVVRQTPTERDPARVVALSDAVIAIAVTLLVLEIRPLLAGTIDAAGVKSIGRRFQLALAWIGTGTLLGALLPALGVAVIAAFIVYYRLPISGEIGGRGPAAGGAEKPPRHDHPDRDR
jgi:hypothetical protein